MDLRPRAAGLETSWSWPQSDTEDSAVTTAADSSVVRRRPFERDTDAADSSHDCFTASTHAGYGGGAPDVPDKSGISDASMASNASNASDASGLTVEPRPDIRPPSEHRKGRFKRRYRPRTCRICLEVVYPTFEDEDEGVHEEEMGVDGLGAVAGGIERIGERVAGVVASAIPSFLRPQPRVRYVSEDPRDGRLVCPCRCKGTQKYVHEGCLTAWRHAQPLSGRNYWKCPTCGFEYRFERLRWGRLISNKVTRALLTLFVFWLAIFFLGFVADPLIDLWVDPTSTIVNTIKDFGDTDGGEDILGNLAGILHPHDAGGGDWGATDGPGGWTEHFLKGFFSLGIVGVIKTFLAVSPFTWLNLRGHVRRRAGGRARIEGFGWMFVLVGAFTFLGVVWKGINYISGRLLELASQHVVDVQGDAEDGSEADDNDDDDDDDEETNDSHDGHEGMYEGHNSDSQDE